MIQHIGAALRRLLPSDSRRGRAARTALLPIVVTVRRRRARAREARAQLPLTYQDFIEQQPLAALQADENLARITIVSICDRKAGGEHQDVRWTGPREAVSVVRVAPGADIAAALEGADSDLALVLRHGDQLTADALVRLTKALRADPLVRLFVFDSDTRGAQGRTAPEFRPEWSPEMLLGANYIGRAFAARTGWLREHAGGITADDRGLWELLLAADLDERSVTRIPSVLLTKPAGPRPPAPSSDDAAMVARVLRARGENVETSVRDGVVRVRYIPSSWPSVSIVVPTRHSRRNLERLLPSLARTDYTGALDVTIVDNGEQSAANEQWYAAQPLPFPLKVSWWTEPFNYSRVNNVAVAATSGEVVVLLNDDTEIVDAQWLEELVGMAVRPGVGTVGLRLLRGDGAIQHGGVVIGPGGFADNLFSGLQPGAGTLLGSSRWYRNSLAVTAACVAVTRTNYEEVGGLDERFQLTGSDVVLGLDQVIRGRRNVVIPFDMVRHYESITRGTDVPRGDFFASYWRYHPWLQAGDPYSSPNVSRASAIPVLKRADEPPAVRWALEALGRPHSSAAQVLTIAEDARILMPSVAISREVVDRVATDHAARRGRHEVRTVNWFVPDIDMPFFGGFNTMFRMADKLSRDHGVVNRFVVLASPNPEFFSSALAAAFPGLADSPVHFYDGSEHSIQEIPPADAAIATLWVTAMHVARAPGSGRRFYLMQDYEPTFYPASTLFAWAELSYRLGLYGICNTVSMFETYTKEYGGTATYFTPAVDRSIYHPADRPPRAEGDPVTIFAYARDHFRNCWELVYAALSEVKRRRGDRVRIVAAGARYLPAAADFIDLGLLDYRATGRLYRETDIGITMQATRHPSYLPLELMASGAAMVVPDSPWFSWLFSDGENAVLSMSTVEDVVARLEQLIDDEELRRRVAHGGVRTIDERHSDWDAALAGIFDYLSDPEANARR